jgi:CcmD family protein
MAENLPWLFGAFVVAWLLIFGYLAWISSQERELRRRVAALQKALSERDKSRQ